MRTNINEYQFIDGFRDSQYKDNFSYEGLKALYEYLIMLEEDIGQEIDFDIVAICCDYSEYTKEELMNDYSYSYGKTIKDFENQEELEEDFLEYIENNTTVIKIDDDNYIIQVF